jgi:hypothetical protein
VYVHGPRIGLSQGPVSPRELTGGDYMNSTLFSTTTKLRTASPYRSSVMFLNCILITALSFAGTTFAKRNAKYVPIPYPEPPTRTCTPGIPSSSQPSDLITCIDYLVQNRTSSLFLRPHPIPLPQSSLILRQPPGVPIAAPTVLGA